MSNCFWRFGADCSGIKHFERFLFTFRSVGRLYLLNSVRKSRSSERLRVVEFYPDEFHDRLIS